jgi:glycosyltransferase involved in cell wall biosynthesis
MQSKSKPTVSFIVIAFNEQFRIAKTLKSIIQQETESIFEIIVVNDGSTDRTSQVAKNCLQDFTQSEVVDCQSNIGRGSARHLGSSHASGDLLAFVDSDVELPRDWLRRCYSMIYEGADAVSGIAIPDGDCVVVARISGLSPRNRPGSAKLTGNNLLIKKSVLDLVPFRKIPYGDDIRLAWDLERMGFRVERLENLVVEHSEKKSYMRTLVWQYQQGKDATKLLFEYHRVRLPDLVWVVFTLACIAGAVLIPSLSSILLFPILFIIYCTAVSFLFICSRFKINPLNFRPYLAIVLNLPLMASYLVGRTVGVPSLRQSHGRPLHFRSGFKNGEK